MPTKVKTTRRTVKSRAQRPKTARKSKRVSRSGDVYVKGFYRHRTPRRRKQTNTTTTTPILAPPPSTPVATVTPNDQTKDPTTADPSTDPTKDPTTADDKATDKTKDKKKGTGRYKFMIFLLLVAIGFGVYFSVRQNPPGTDNGRGQLGGDPDVLTKGKSSGKAQVETIVFGALGFVVALGLSIYRLFSKDYGSPSEIGEAFARKSEEGEVEAEAEVASALHMAAGHGSKDEHGGLFDKAKGTIKGKK